MKIFLILVCFVLCTSATFAQPIIAVKGGLNIADIAKGGEATKSLIGFHAGLAGRFVLSDHFYVQPELLFAQKGNDTKNTIDNLEIKFQYDYLSLPVLFGVNFGKGLSVQAGPAINYLLTVHSKIGSQSNSGKGEIADFEFGLMAGLEYKFKRFAMYARYEHGLTEYESYYLTDINGQSLGLVKGGANRVVQVGVGYDLTTKSNDQ
jgi:hypothetical protein